MNFKESDNESINYSVMRLPYSEVTVKYPSTWRYDPPGRNNNETSFFMPPSLIYDHSYKVGLGVKAYVNDLKREFELSESQNVMVGILKELSWGSDIEMPNKFDMESPFSSIISDVDEGVYKVGGEVIEDRWSLQRVVLNNSTKSLYHVFFRVPLYRKSLFENVGREMVTNIKFNPSK